MNTSLQHFQSQAANKGFYPPDNVKFAVYSNKIWQNFLSCIHKGSTILDLGCGGGTVLHSLYHLGYPKLYGLDFIDTIPPGFVPGVTFTQSDVLNNHLKPNYFDAIVSTMVIEHVNDRQFVKEVYRLLKPGGTALITSVLLTSKPWYFYKNPSGLPVLEPTHLKEYNSINSYQDLFSSFGILSLDTPRLIYPLIDPLFVILYRFIKKDFIKNLPTTNPFLKKLRFLRIPIPGYHSIEILVRKPLQSANN